MGLILFLIFSFSSFGADLFKCTNGNTPSICEQEVEFNKIKGKLISLDVVYAGDCAGQGPFNYKCNKNICADDNIRIRLIGDTRYHWENRPYGFFCDFVKVR